MCGRFTLTTPAEVIADVFDVAATADLAPRYNIAPTQHVLAIRGRGDSQGRESTKLRWGLIPSWAKDAAVGNRMINARAETVAEKPAFRSAFKRRRCLIVADGFFEWQAPTATGATKQPYWIHACDRRPFAMAGLWETWQRDDGEKIESCSIITTTANSLMEPIHARMPVVLQPDDFGPWLDVTRPIDDTREALAQLLVPYPSDRLRAVKVSIHVNSPRNDDPRCIEPLE